MPKQNVKTRDYNMVNIIKGVTKAGIEPDQAKEQDKYACRGQGLPTTNPFHCILDREPLRQHYTSEDGMTYGYTCPTCQRQYVEEYDDFGKLSFNLVTPV